MQPTTIGITKSEKKKFNYFGKGAEFAVIYFKNLLLTIITLGVY